MVFMYLVRNLKHFFHRTRNNKNLSKNYSQLYWEIISQIYKYKIRSTVWCIVLRLGIWKWRFLSINKSNFFLAGFKLLILLCVYFGEIVDLQTFSSTIRPSDIYKKIISFKDFNPFEVFTVTSFSCLASSTSPQMKWLVFRVTIGIVSSIICLSYSLCY